MSTLEKYKQACEAIVQAGGTPMPITDTLIEIIKRVVEEDELDFILAFTEKKSQTMEQLKENSGLSKDEIIGMTDRLAKKGVIFNQPSSSGLMVYRLLPLMNVGIFEYMFMQKLEFTQKNKELGQLFTTLFNEQKGLAQQNHDMLVEHIEFFPPVDRTIPIRENKITGNPTIIDINQTIDAEEKILPTKNVVDLIQKFDEIAVGYCFCRHHKDIMDEPCRQTDMRECCFTFGKSARYTSEQGFMRMINKEEALEILLKAEEDGLVHKAYHPNFDTSKEETSICNCCKCCCGNSADNQIAPIVNVANYIAEVDPDACVGCGQCTEYCHPDAISLEGELSVIDKDRCIGCGVCAHFCPEEAIRLTESDRIVRIAPPKSADV